MIATAAGLLADLRDVGRDARRGGYSRPVFSVAETELREWFLDVAAQRGLETEIDRNGGMWAWLDVASGDRTGAVVTGSHLDSVPGGGAFDGPLGVVSALTAVDHLRARQAVLARPLAVAVFAEEEGSRYGLACLGSGLTAGTVDPARALALRDDTGTTLADLARSRGLDPGQMGADPGRLAGISAFVELHIEQGRALVDLDEPVAVGTSILAHGRWRLTLTGRGDHAGTTAMADRCDPMTVAASVVLAVRDVARRVPGARGTVGKVVPVPGGANVIASAVDVWIDVRHEDDAVVAALVREIEARATRDAEVEGCQVRLTEESWSPVASFDTRLRDRLATTLPAAPLLSTGAGHDAGVLAPHVPTAMLFVRNPTGVSHSPEEHAEDVDVDAGASSLADVLADLAATPSGLPIA